jgi:hypothetical protein
LYQIAPGLGSSARRIEGCISRYVAFNATQQMGQRPSKLVQLFFAEALTLKTHFVVVQNAKCGYLYRRISEIVNINHKGYN